MHASDMQYLICQNVFCTILPNMYYSPNISSYTVIKILLSVQKLSSIVLVQRNQKSGELVENMQA